MTGQVCNTTGPLTFFIFYVPHAGSIVPRAGTTTDHIHIYPPLHDRRAPHVHI